MCCRKGVLDAAGSFDGGPAGGAGGRDLPRVVDAFRETFGIRESGDAGGHDLADLRCAVDGEGGGGAVAARGHAAAGSDGGGDDRSGGADDAFDDAVVIGIANDDAEALTDMCGGDGQGRGDRSDGSHEFVDPDR